MIREGVNIGGRPRLYADTPEDIERWEKELQGYINSITYYKTVTAKQPSGEVDKKGNTIYIDKPVVNAEGEEVRELAFATIPSVIGLALYLDMNPETLSNYGKRDGFSNSYKKVMKLIEQEVANKLQTQANVAGLIFTLKNNHGWQDKKELEVTSKSKLEDFFND